MEYRVLKLGTRQDLFIEANENDLLTAEICSPTIAGNIIKIRSGTDFTLLLNRPHIEHLVYDLQKCLNNHQPNSQLDELDQFREEAA